MPRLGVGAGPGVLHWSAWEPSAVGVGIGDQLLHRRVCGAAGQARSASNRRHRLHTCRVLAPGTTPVVPHGTQALWCLRPPQASVRSACLPLGEEPCETERLLPAGPTAGLGDARGSGFPGSQPAALPSAPAPPSTTPQPDVELCHLQLSDRHRVPAGEPDAPRRAGRSARLGEQDPREGLGDRCWEELRRRGTNRETGTESNPRDICVPTPCPHPEGQTSTLLSPPTSCPMPRVTPQSLCPKQVCVENRPSDREKAHLQPTRTEGCLEGTPEVVSRPLPEAFCPHSPSTVCHKVYHYQRPWGGTE